MISIWAFYVFLHVENYNRIVEILYTKKEVVVEVLQVFFPYEKEYDSKRKSMDKDMDGKITKNEAMDFAEREGIATNFLIVFKVGNKKVFLKRVKSEVEEYPHRTYEAPPIVIWHRFEGNHTIPVCKTFSYIDFYRFRKAVVKLKLKGVCGVKEKEIIRELTPTHRVMKVSIKDFN